ncbi:hypothetical protein H072_9889 [Dactylellina haptotyla CBS 200.50]|uniref:Uncharacterized protein n=1 Tax=Dactylellina haptotyla (strain CBS 200.50) TaxID=1284197 RepID=S8A0S0_DACHA|nr:hypothetical protein H072_9889 [Dactylellina haptotyla CBS 200.50]
MSKHNRQDPIPLEPTTSKRPRLDDDPYHYSLQHHTPHHVHHIPHHQQSFQQAQHSPSKPRYPTPAELLLNPKAARLAAASTSQTPYASSGSGSGSSLGSTPGYASSGSGVSGVSTGGGVIRQGNNVTLPPLQLQDAGSRAANMLLNLHGVVERNPTISPFGSRHSSPFGRQPQQQQQQPLQQQQQGYTGYTGESSSGNSGHVRSSSAGFAGSNGRSSGIRSIPRLEDTGSKSTTRRLKRSPTPEIQFLNSRFSTGSSHVRNSSVVDLTNEEEEDDIIYSGTKSIAPVVCYGMIVKVQASIAVIPDPPPNLDPLSFGRMWPKIPVTLTRGDPKSYVVNLTTASGTNVGTLRGANAKAMASLMDLGLVDRTQAIILPRYKGFEVAGQPTSKSVEMTITLYGTEGNAKKVGNMLGQHNLFLQDPIDKDPKFPYRNPQYPEEQRENGSAYMAAIDRARLGKATYSIRTTEEVKNEITQVLDSLEKVQVLEETEAEPSITTAMLPHQKQGLNFMLKKESERTYEQGDDATSFWNVRISPGGVKMYHNVITGQQTRSKPPGCLGGILADDMGLGKTLTVLSLIVATLQDAANFGNRRKDGPSSEHDLSLMYAKSTLLICPLSVLVNWEDQIRMHVQPDTISYYVYHGNNRLSDLNELAKYDMVITTYALAASDFGKAQKENGSVLQRIHWYRIVLDEAHTIREQNTVQSKAICNMEASRRWAVTGTPVQNRLDDLGTLIKFLRLSPFEARSQFNQYISAPLKSGDPTSMDKLRILVDSIALRRRKDRIDLPTKHDRTLHLRFSPQEQELYDATSRQSRYKIDMVAKQGHLSGKAYVHVLQTILRLRMICASRDLLGDEDTAGLISSNAIDIDSLTDEETHAMGKKQAFEIFNLMKESDEDICYTCQKKVNPANARDGTPTSSDANAPFGHITSCPHLFCTECGPKYLSSLLEYASMGDWTNCPLCRQPLRIGMRDLKASEDPSLQKDDNGKRKVVYRNPSTKIMQLVADLLDNREMGDEGRRIKSVIFSGWTMHLDLIEYALDNVGIRWTRIDGKMNRSQRADSLIKFRDDPDIECILVSISAGGVGLNLTAASRVYVMEPQFNPAAEAQAIDRVHRLGQDREVWCTRYIMENSFEEKIVALQKKKQRIADLSMTQGKSKRQRAQDKIDDLKELFR